MVVIVCIYIVALSALKFIIYDIFDALLKPWKPELINIAAEINKKSHFNFYKTPSMKLESKISKFKVDYRNS